MIVTLTLNPSLDRTVEVPFLERGAVIRTLDGHVDPGGKGVNVARALLASGVEARAILPVGGRVGHQLVELLEAEGVVMTSVQVGADTRSNLTLSEPDGTVTKINEAGGALTEAEIERLADALLLTAGAADWVVASGSLPPATPTNVYARLVTRLAAHDIKLAVDTSGPALAQAVAAGAALVKPNREELSEAVGWEVWSLADAVKAAESLRDQGAQAVLVSLGPDGAVLIDDDGAVHGRCPVDVPRSSVGAGDCLLAGFLAAGARGEKALATALQWAAAAVELPGSRVPTPADINGRLPILRRDIDRQQALSPSS
ncbi:MAG: 1-phosphofructokinase [Actinomycetota bacterium]|nr:1-phosphofructokinase [Actinomycetota bacterium]